jgi:hypothetical protein
MRKSPQQYATQTIIFQLLSGKAAQPLYLDIQTHIQNLLGIALLV